MNNVDLFVILDNVKYRKNYFQNRNIFLNNSGNEEWFGVSVPKNSTSKLIKDVITVDNNLNHWRTKVIKKIQNNMGINMENVYLYDKLIDINIKSIEWCREKMGIKTPMVYSSSLFSNGSKSSLLVDICKKTNAKTYLSGPSGKDYLDIDMFLKEEINVEFFEPKVSNYYSMLYNLSK